MMLDFPSLTPTRHERLRQFIAEARAAFYQWVGMSGHAAPNAKPVIVNGVRYASTLAASMATGINEESIQAAAQRGGTTRYYPPGAKNQRKNLRVLHARYARKEKP